MSVDPLALDIIGSAIVDSGSRAVSFTVAWTAPEGEKEHGNYTRSGVRRFANVVMATGAAVAKVPMLRAASEHIGTGYLGKDRKHHHKVLVARMHNQELIILDVIA